jgi:antitoxin PrlF
MAIAQSKLTTQGQISVPAQVRRKLGVAPGSVLEWDEADGQVVVRRASRYSSDDMHQALFPSEPETRTLTQLKDGIRRDIKRRFARKSK